MKTTKKQKQSPKQKTYTAVMARRELADLDWLKTNTSLSYEAYDRLKAACLDKLEASRG